MKILIVAIVAVLGGLNCAHAAALLSEQQARAKGAQILKGDPYGKTEADAAKSIAEAKLINAGNTEPCSKRQVNKPVWSLHVVVKGSSINGYMALDARTGKMNCAGLPFLD